MARINDLQQSAKQQVISVIYDSENVISYKYLLDNCLFLSESYRHRWVDLYGDNCTNITYSCVS